MFDLVIKDAEIYDGAGSAPVRGDLGVTNGRIEAVGSSLGAAKETVKADGLALGKGVVVAETEHEALTAIDRAPLTDQARRALCELATYVAWRDE